MIDRIIEFSLNHTPLVMTFAASIAGLFFVESKRAGETVTPVQAVQLINKERAVLLDVREAKQFKEGHIAGAMNIVHTNIKQRLTEIQSYKEKPIILVCAMGQHVGAVGKLLKQSGFKDVRRLQGGIAGWKNDQLPLIK